MTAILTILIACVIAGAAIYYLYNLLMTLGKIADWLNETHESED